MEWLNKLFTQWIEFNFWFRCQHKISNYTQVPAQLSLSRTSLNCAWQCLKIQWDRERGREKGNSDDRTKLCASMVLYQWLHSLPPSLCVSFPQTQTQTVTENDDEVYWASPQKQIQQSLVLGGPSFNTFSFPFSFCFSFIFQLLFMWFSLLLLLSSAYSYLCFYFHFHFHSMFSVVVVVFVAFAAIVVVVFGVSRFGLWDYECAVWFQVKC